MTWLLVTRYALVAQFWRFWASFPGIHIAQFPFQVIGNCGVSSLMHRSIRQRVKISGQAHSGAEGIKVLGGIVERGRWFKGTEPELSVGDARKMTVSWRWRPL